MDYVHSTYIHQYNISEWRAKEKWDVRFLSNFSSFLGIFWDSVYRFRVDSNGISRWNRSRQEKCVRATSWKFNYHHIVLGCWCAYFKYLFTVRFFFFLSSHLRANLFTVAKVRYVSVCVCVVCMCEKRKIICSVWTNKQDVFVECGQWKC